MSRMRASVEDRIHLTVLAFFALQVGYLLCITVVFALPAFRLAAFIAASAIYHGLFYLGLRRVQREFALEATGSPLRAINFPLVLSFLRLSSVPAAIFLFLSIGSISISLVLAPFLVVVFLTDLLDGLLARILHQQTRIGRIVDAAGDYVLIFTLTVLFALFELIPWWLAALVLFRLVLQSAGIVALYRLRGYSSLKLTFLGKASVFSVFCLYGFELAEYMSLPLIGSPRLISVLELLTAGVIAASLVDKVLFLRREIRAVRGQQS